MPGYTWCVTAWRSGDVLVVLLGLLLVMVVLREVLLVLILMPSLLLLLPPSEPALSAVPARQ
jgi:hypothetical protein